MQLLLLFLNSKCEAFRTLDGNLSPQGERRLDILANLYHLPRIAFPAVAAECNRIKMPSKEEFLHEYLFRSKPVIIEGRVYFHYKFLVVNPTREAQVVQVVSVLCPILVSMVHVREFL